MIRTRLITTLALALVTAAASGCGSQKSGTDDAHAGNPPGAVIPAPVKPAPGTGGNDGGTTEPGDGTDGGTTEPGDGNTDPGTEPTDPGPGEEPAAKVDTFGVTMIYPSVPNGEAWFLGEDANNDPRFDPQDPVTRNDDGSWKMTESQVRMHALTSSGYDSGKIETYDRETLTEKGYMQAPNDWKNVEMTGFVKVNEASDETDNFAWYARGGRHSDGIACEGSAYKGDLHYDGRFRVAKETWHVSYEQGAYGDVTIDPIIGRWVGFKAVIRNTTSNGKPAVSTELWVNDSADKVSWEKVYEIVDDGSMGGNSDQCGARDPAMPLTWGGPLATFRWDSTSDVDFKWLSVREIQPLE